MPRYNVEHNGKWACFSSVCDAFITCFMDKCDYENWRLQEYGSKNYKPVEECNLMTMDEAVYSVHLNRTREEAFDCLLEFGLTEEECKQFVYDMETKHFCPIKKDNGKYECPNCRHEVYKNQVTCEDETCCLDFVWRE